MKSLFPHLLTSIALLSSPLFADPTFIKDENTLTIKTPALSERKTEKLRLDNGLEILIISDPSIESSAAALAMNVGSWSDPENYPGTAHFTEHLLFLGSKAYPSEGGFMRFINEHGGQVNAYTAFDKTVYMFSINNDAFTSALDQFAHMFIDPLFLESGIRRELHAVDQENDKNIENDAWREFMVLKELSRKDHPFSKFTTGNAATLGTIPREKVQEWYETHYGAKLAKLVIYTNKPLSEITPFVTESFEEMPDGKFTPDTSHRVIFQKESLGKLVHINPIKELKELEILWEVPEEFVGDYSCKTASLVSYVLSSRSPTSLYASLKKDGLIDELYAGEDRWSKSQSVFCVSFSLTESGIHRTQEILSRLHETLATLRENSIPPYIFQELRTMRETDYAFQSKSDPFTFVSNAAAGLINESLATYPEKTIVPTAYEPKKIQALLSAFTPENAIYFLQVPSKYVDHAPEKKERWYGVEYDVRPVEQKMLTSWKKAQKRADIAIQKPNPYLPKDLSLKTAPVKATSPSFILSNESGKLAFIQDTEFLTPTISLRIGIKTPEIRPTAESKVLLDIYLKSLDEKLADTVFYGESAGISVATGCVDSSLQLALSGYSEKAPLILEEMLKGMKNLSTSEMAFTSYKQILRSYYENQTKDLPFLCAKRSLSSILSNDEFTSNEKAEALKKINFDSYAGFEKALLQSAFFKMTATGNLTEKESTSLFKTVQKTLKSKPYPVEEHFQKRILALQDEGSPLLVAESSAMQGNVALLCLEAGSFTFDNWAAHAVLGKILNSDFFDTLRTKQQTGYITSGSTSYADGQLLQVFGVQSTTHQPEELVARFELFLEEYTKQFEQMIPQDRFERNKLALIETLSAPSTNLDMYCDEMHRCAYTFDGNFTWKESQKTAVEILNYDTFKKRALEVLSRTNSRRLAYLLHGTSPTDKSFKYLPVSPETLRETHSFVSWKDTQ